MRLAPLRVCIFVLIAFVLGVAVGTLRLRPVATQNAKTGLRLSVVGIAVPAQNYEASRDFYTKVMGMKLAFAWSSPDGKRTNSYLQLNRDTFIELQTAADGASASMTHIHTVTEDLDAKVAQLRRAGATVSEPRVVSPTMERSVNVTEPNGIHVEVNELVPDSLTRRAFDDWK
jgi:predicted enzyme related to lactoylglutathione lyase